MISFIALIALVDQVHAEPAGIFLRTMQATNGGFFSDPLKVGETPKPTLRTTRTGIRVFRLLGLPLPNRDKVLAFHAACFDPETGGFAAEPGGKPDPISTSVALMILKEMKLPTDKYETRALAFMNEKTKGFEDIRMVAPGLEELSVTVPNAKKWEAEVHNTINPDGSFGHGLTTARETALHGVAILRLGGQIDKGATLRALRSGQLSDGGFGNGTEHSDLESCYRVMRLFGDLDGMPDRMDDVRGFIASCKHDDGGYGRTPDEPSSLHGTYYATIVSSWIEQLEKAHPEAKRKKWTFDEDPTGKIPAGWRVANTRLPATASWQIEECPGGKCFAQTATNGAYKQFNLAVSDYRCVNADLRVRIHPRSGEMDRGGGIVWRYYDPQNYYVARWNPLENNVRLFKVVDGSRSQIDSAKVPAGDGWRTLRIVAYGRNVRGYFDGRICVEAQDDQFIQPGRIGLWTKSDAATEFDDFQVATALADSVEELKVPAKE
jgi:hypothetical protein